ncbi:MULTISPECIES: M48 family metallopeptidase [Roseateles]|uniref:M48 family metallopeptidase n=1 Tax=Roseateles albus TaxID=2987525 RepID=A0ABT5K917_9BURK|nr:MULTISPECIES: M48 family metallopeptidase [Roseateles]MCV2359959.1 M48 family metallopeptidase [Paucibacter sp. TC2R-5]MDC8770456.1 M48 family metallopeptidase [Roseateles albus]
MPQDFDYRSPVSSSPLCDLPAFGHCACHSAGAAGKPYQRSRRLFTGLLGATALLPAWARDGVEVGKTSSLTKLVPAEQVEQAGAQQYQQMMGQANQQRALAPANHPQLIRLRSIAKRIIPQAMEWNPRAKDWRWEVNLIADPQLNAFCMPGGKIAFFYGILEKLQLTDDEVATIMGHEVAHALREHARERMAKTQATRLGASVLSSLLGLGNVGDAVLGMGGQLLTLTFSREDESEADLVGMELAARAGYDPAAGITLWQKMGAASKGAPPQWLSTHPAGPTRIRDIEANLPKVKGLYEKAEKPSQRFDVAPPLRRQATQG